MQGMNPQQVTIDQLPDEQLAIYGWNQYRGLEGARKQALLCEQNIQAIAQELDGRAKKRQEAAQEEEGAKKSDHDILMAKIEKLLNGRNSLPTTNGTPAPEAKISGNDTGDEAE